MKKYIEIANRIYQEKYSNAEFLILAGSIIRGEGTMTSDLDIVVIYEKIDCAFRESFIYEGIMVEVFAHDLSTAKYFMHTVDFNNGAPIIATMITEGIVIPKKIGLSDELKRIAEEFISKGPNEANINKINSMRYSITNLIDDLIDSKNRYEQIATGCRLYEEVAELYFSANRIWNGKAKSIVRVMKKHDHEFAERYNDSFDLLFKNGDDSMAVEISEEVLNLVGGYLFNGYRLVAKPEWRIV
ncbi:nucleotidyltransferase domain-containing protein [Alkaliphilus sp. B6464]|uniref:nucleotidyltransferase domain-containing protein n=1 Tax=Alkaliphilus sp. B6464 TaxID=2731219 RepID=UPI001BAB8A9F|nr:nucleotidyltransferase domain-containing protein [Alkaliphilus sp. B6464]QUH20174.1 hypothetical protein HYG84_09830 [Alkaliphilus sp. B6464]